MGARYSFLTGIYSDPARALGGLAASILACFSAFSDRLSSTFHLGMRLVTSDPRSIHQAHLGVFLWTAWSTRYILCDQRLQPWIASAVCGTLQTVGVVYSLCACAAYQNTSAGPMRWISDSQISQDKDNPSRQQMKFHATNQKLRQCT